MTKANWYQLACVVMGTITFAMGRDGSSSWFAAGFVIAALNRETL